MTKRFQLGVLVVAAAGISALMLWVGPADGNSLKDQLRWVTPRSIELCFLLMSAGFVANYRGVRQSLPSPRVVPLVVFVVALVAVSWLPPRAHRIYFDEDIYQNVAQNIVWEGRAQMCNEGFLTAGAFDCEAWEYNKEPNGFPFLLSTVFRFSGVSEDASHRLNRWLFALGAMAVYWVAALLFAKTQVAIGAALVYTLTPQNLLWGSTVAVEPSAATFATIGVGAWLYFCKHPSWRAGIFGASALAFATQFRPESGLVLAVAALGMLLLAPSLLRRREVYGAAVLLLLLLLPHFAHLWAVRHEKWGSDDAKFSVVNAQRNWKPNTRYYYEGADFPPFFTFAAFLGLLHPRRRQVGVALAWFLLLFGIFIPFYAGSYRYGADVRFAFVSAAPLAILAGAGLGLASAWLARRFQGARWPSFVPCVLAVYAFSHFLPLVRAVGSEGWQARADHDAALEMVEAIPEDAVVLTHNPGMVQIMGRSAAQVSLVSYQPARVDGYFDRFPGGVFFHYNFWCNVSDDVQNEFCGKVLATYQTQVVMERSAGFYRYVLYRLLPNSHPPPLN